MHVYWDGHHFAPPKCTGINHVGAGTAAFAVVDGVNHLVKNISKMIIVSMSRIYLKNKIFTIEYLKEPSNEQIHAS